MTDQTRMRREKVLVLRTINCDPEVDSLDGPNPVKIKAGEVVALPPVVIAHYQRNKCVTRDLPLEA